jgi:hypothetical protein
LLWGCNVIVCNRIDFATKRVADQSQYSASYPRRGHFALLDATLTPS